MEMTRIDLASVRKKFEKEEKDAAAHTASVINDRLMKLSPDTVGYGGSVSIYRVPEKHRNKNPEAYTPRLVSIGFVHHGQLHLQAMEVYKLRYLKHFLLANNASLHDLAYFVRREERNVSGCYEDIYVRNLISPSREKLSEVLLLDGIFILELLGRNYFHSLGVRKENIDRPGSSSGDSFHLRKVYDELGRDLIFDDPWISNDILHDLLLFENQLPLEFLRQLHTTFFKALDKPFDELAFIYFEVKGVGNVGKHLTVPLNSDQSRHFVEFLWNEHTPSDYTSRAHWVSAAEIAKVFAKCPTATELHAAGVTFQPVTAKIFLDVKFDNRSGVLKISPLTVNESTETFFRNLIAFEQSGGPFINHTTTSSDGYGCYLKFITSFVIMLDNLIDTPKDVDLLIEGGIIKNELGGSAQVAELINRLYNEFVIDEREFCFFPECKELNEYSLNWWWKWRANAVKWFEMLGRDYFGNPWSIIAVVAAAVALGLTIIQTVCSVLQVQDGRKKQN